MSNETLPVAPPNSARRCDLSVVVMESTPTGALTYTGLTPKGLELAREFSSKGYTHAAFAARAGISMKGWVAIRERDSNAFNAWEEGRAILDSRYTDKLNKHVDEDNLTALLAAMKFKLGYRDTGPTDPNNGTGPTINIQINAPLPATEVTSLIGEIPPLPEDQD